MKRKANIFVGRKAMASSHARIAHNNEIRRKQFAHGQTNSDQITYHATSIDLRDCHKTELRIMNLYRFVLYCVAADYLRFARRPKFTLFKINICINNFWTKINLQICCVRTKKKNE